uniref:NADH-ubiquinone oxidoreductase chain 1 n=2 Tax=Xenos TaxID=32435 RepID=A0A7T1T1K5_9NEOP|nr:NADH dehydrogenase subunit 1 [Xenos yangi]QPP04710.1 NADH dehydrogenase subunit 1 [Xenos cf. moutoni RZ-2020]UXG18687.1 NADH dehydrogenase subunit 1 [Xenos yangi]
MIFINYLFLLIFILFSVAFITLFERKILGYIQDRKSVNKVGYMGLFQPFSDGIKLLLKESSMLNKFNFLLFLMAPLMNFFIIIMMYMLLPYDSLMDWFNLGILYFLSLLSLNVLSVILIGWSSNSSYSFLSSIRMVAQMISYEISLMFLLLSLMISSESFSLMMFMKVQKFIWLLSCYFVVSGLMFIIFLAESNRVPFDFIEGESELVSGFNIEYGSGYFTFIFVAEYLSILLMCYVFIMFFFSGNLLSFNFYLKLMMLVYLYMMIRGAFPRFRYDKLMMMAWKVFLPLTLGLYIFYFSIIMLLKI